jgi:hypothetical protein
MEKKIILSKKIETLNEISKIKSIYFLIIIIIIIHYTHLPHNSLLKFPCPLF